MKIEPVIRSRFLTFRTSRGLEHMSDGEAFERFVAYTLLSAHQPDAFGSHDDILESVCVGGGNDMGIDGIAVLLNDLIVTSPQDVEDILDVHRRARVQFVFIQSKHSQKFDLGDFNKFVSGVRDFLGNDQLAPHNAKIEAALKLKDHLLSDEVVIRWESNPTVRLYYVSMGAWKEAEPHLAQAERTKRDIAALNTYGECSVHFYDAAALKIACDNGENRFTAVMEAVESMPLTAVEGVDNSCIVLCYAPEYIALLTTEDGVIRKALFNDNVRDFQGENSVNLEISASVAAEPHKFGLLNNGITIVCDEFLQSNRRITVKNPQVVNGCQTSHILFDAHKRGIDVSSVPLHIKIIATHDSVITNQIVRGTNRQNIVFDESFEATRAFHKDLEEFFDAVSAGNGRIYYERRSKQYQHDPRIKYSQRVNLRGLTQSFVGMFLNRPDLAHRHESKLLKEFGDRIFLDRHSKLPYFAASWTYLEIEKYLRETAPNNELRSFRAHLMMLFRQLTAGDLPDINSEKAIDAHSEAVLSVLRDKAAANDFFAQAGIAFSEGKKKWTDRGRSSYGMKDIHEFTQLLLESTNANPRAPGVSSTLSVSADDFHVGQVVRVMIDKNGQYCGLIRRRSGDLFFHSNDSPLLDFESALWSYVSFKLGKNRRTGEPRAVRVALDGA